MPILLIVSQNHLREKTFQIYDIVNMSLFKSVISLKAPKTKYANQKQTMQKRHQITKSESICRTFSRTFEIVSSI